MNLGAPVGFLVELLVTLGVILGWRHFRPGDPPSLASVLGPPAIAWAATMVITLPLMLALLVLSGAFPGTATRELPMMAAVGGLMACGITWTSAALYAVVAALMAIFPAQRAAAPWLLRSAGVAGAGAIAVLGAMLAALFFGFRGLGGD